MIDFNVRDRGTFFISDITHAGVSYLNSIGVKLNAPAHVFDPYFG